MAEAASSPLVRFLARRRVTLGFLTVVPAVLLADPTWASWRLGLVIAAAGEAIRIWAAGHLEKGTEVTRSGPYRWTAHPLYAGSAVLALGVVIAARSPVIALLVAVYMGSTITAAVRSEEAYLRRTFGPDYDAYRRSAAAPMARGFSRARVARNREYRAVIGVGIGFAFLALKLVLEI